MKVGLLWFDDDAGRDLPQKAAQAAARYCQKHGVVPNTCYVHPTMLPDGRAVAVGPVQVRPLASVLRHHFWLGVEE